MSGESDKRCVCGHPLSQHNEKGKCFCRCEQFRTWSAEEEVTYFEKWGDNGPVNFVEDDVEMNTAPGEAIKDDGLHY